MKCDECMDRFLELDGNEPSGELAAHLASCPRCSEEARRLVAAFSFLAEEGRRKPDRDLTDGIMAALYMDSIGKAPKVEKEDVEAPLRTWLWSGAVIMVGMLLIPFSTILPELSGRYGSSLDITLHLILGLVITLYGTIFIASHMGLLRKIALRLENIGLRK